MTSVLLAAAAAGTLLGGLAAQRFGRRLVLVVPQLVLVPAIALLPSLSYAAMIPVVVLIGIAMNANVSIALVLAQEYLPARMGLATGLTIGLCGGAGGLIVAALGLLGDAAGPSSVLYAIAALPAGGRRARLQAAAAGGRSTRDRVEPARRSLVSRVFPRAHRRGKPWLKLRARRACPPWSRTPAASRPGNRNSRPGKPDSATVANAVLPSRAICAAPVTAYGLRTDATDDAAATRASIVEMRDCTAESRTVPLATCHTIVAASPACLGSDAMSSVRALVDSVPGSENEVE